MRFEWMSPVHLCLRWHSVFNKPCSSVLCSALAEENSFSKDKQQSPWLIALCRGESKPYCWHQEASDVMVMSMPLIVNCTHSLAVGCGNIFSQREDSEGDSVSWKTWDVIQYGCNWGWDRNRYVCLLFIPDLKIGLFFFLHCCLVEIFISESLNNTISDD